IGVLMVLGCGILGSLHGYLWFLVVASWVLYMGTYGFGLWRPGFFTWVLMVLGCGIMGTLPGYYWFLVVVSWVLYLGTHGFGL
ncbi:MAG: hypothetical protein WCQ70_09680, partial [Lentimicrobiaceae bacterium]